MAHIIREISIKDVEDFIKLLSKIYDESEYTLYNPGEYTPSISSVSNHLERIITSPRNTVYVAEQDDQLKIMNVNVMKQSLQLALDSFIRNTVSVWH